MVVAPPAKGSMTIPPTGDAALMKNSANPSAHDISGIGTAQQVGFGPIAAEPCFSTAAPRRVSFTPRNLGLIHFIGHPHSIEIEVRPGPPGEMIDIFKAVLGAWTEPSRDAIGLRPDIGLNPAPADVL